MNWIIQDSLSWTALQNNCNPLILALQKLNKKFYTCGVIPFEHKITGIDEIDLSIPTMFYGGTLLPILAKKLNYKGEIFWEDDYWNPSIWANNRSDMLNQNIIESTIGELKEHWISKPTFIKPIAVKEFTGMVLEGIEDKDWFIQEYSALDSKLKIICSPALNIEREWRFWIVGGKVITGSQYKKNGCLAIKAPIEDRIYNIVNEMSQVWLPTKNVVMDISEMRNGEFKVVEFNSIHSSGFYNADIEKFIIAIEREYER
jgi:hypothetical protein